MGHEEDPTNVEREKDENKIEWIKGYGTMAKYRSCFIYIH